MATAPASVFAKYVAAVGTAGGVVTNWPFAGTWSGLFSSAWQDANDMILAPAGTVAVDDVGNIIAVRFDNATYAARANDGTFATLGLIGQPQRPADSGDYMYIMAPPSLNVNGSIPDLSGQYLSTANGGLDNPNPAPQWYQDLVNKLGTVGTYAVLGAVGYVAVRVLMKSDGPKTFR